MGTLIYFSCLQLLSAISTIDDLNYPEKTETYYIVNAPYIFSSCWKVCHATMAHSIYFHFQHSNYDICPFPVCRLFDPFYAREQGRKFKFSLDVEKMNC